MRKSWLLMVLAAILILTFVPPSVMAYSPHYLPGGTNYLASDNFERESGYYSSIDPFLIKPNTTYCLALPGEYTTYQQYDVILEFYVNAAVSTTVTLTETDFYIWESTTWEYAVFTTPATANYLDLSLFEPDSYFTTHDIEGFQLEEGTEFTGYVAYVEGSLADINGPYFSGTGVVVTGVDDELPLAAITAGLTATDAVDGDVTADIVVVSDGYSANIGVLGSYVITYQVTDAAANTTEFQITVLVVDVVARCLAALNRSASLSCRPDTGGDPGTDQRKRQLRWRPERRDRPGDRRLFCPCGHHRQLRGRLFGRRLKWEYGLPNRDDRSRRRNGADLYRPRHLYDRLRQSADRRIDQIGTDGHG